MIAEAFFCLGLKAAVFLVLILFSNASLFLINISKDEITPNLTK